MKFKKIHSNFKLPEYSTPGSAAFDLALMESTIVNKWTSTTVGLGFAAEVPEGYVALIAPRSSKGFNDGLSLANTVGVIDSDYRGEWKAKLLMSTPVSDAVFVEYEAGERILQCMIVPVNQVKPELVGELSDTDRGDGGIGSTGK